jgi:hypothetical protein
MAPFHRSPTHCMLDVHPPHESVHSWKDFLIHMSAICLGLLIAIALEQTVEWLHHRHQLREVRAQLAEERDLNLRLLARNAELDVQMKAELDADLQLLLRHLGQDKTPLNGNIHYEWFSLALQTGAWQSATQSVAIGLMPEKELVLYSYRYHVIDYYTQSTEAFNSTMEHAAAIVRGTPDGNLSPDDTRDLIRLTHEAAGQLALDEKLMFFTRQYGLANALDYSFLDQPAPKLY